MGERGAYILSCQHSTPLLSSWWNHQKEGSVCSRARGWPGLMPRPSWPTWWMAQLLAMRQELMYVAGLITAAVARNMSDSCYCCWYIWSIVHWNEQCFSFQILHLQIMLHFLYLVALDSWVLFTYKLDGCWPWPAWEKVVKYLVPINRYNICLTINNLNVPPYLDRQNNVDPGYYTKYGMMFPIRAIDNVWFSRLIRLILGHAAGIVLKIVLDRWRQTW